MKITITTFSDTERDKTKVTMKAHGWKIVMLGEEIAFLKREDGRNQQRILSQPRNPV